MAVEFSQSASLGGGGDRKKIVVIGGGIVGILTAWSFLKQGHDVTVYDRGVAEDRCSYGNAGSLSSGSVAPLGMPGILAQVPKMLLQKDAPLHIRPTYLFSVVPWLARFVASSTPRRVEAISFALSELLSDSIERYRRLLGEIESPELLEQRGQIHVYPSERYRATDLQSWNLKRRRGVVAEDISREELIQLEPSIGPRYGCRVFLPNEGLIVSPGRLIDVFWKAYSRNGGKAKRGRVHTLNGSDRRVVSVTGEGGLETADVVVVAAGAWSNAISQLSGDNLPLQTQRGYHLNIRKAGVSLQRSVCAADRKYFVSPMEAGLRIAGTVEFDDLNADPNVDRATALARYADDLLPGIETDGATEWMGHRPCMPDSLPVIDRSSRFRNVFYAFGNGHLGLTGAPKMAEAVRSLALDQEPVLDLQPFRAARFRGFDRVVEKAEA